MGVQWLFEIDETLYFSTKTTSFGGQDYTGIIVPTSFNGVQDIRIKKEIGSYGVSKGSITLLDDDSAYAASDFKGKKLIIREVIGGVEKRNWRFKITSAVEIYKKWTISYSDFLSTLIEGVWPNTGLIKDIAPESQVKVMGEYAIDENACLPVIFGTAYIPLQSIAEDGHVYFVLGGGRDVLGGLGKCLYDWCGTKGDGCTYSQSSVRYDWDGSQSATSYTYDGVDYCETGVTYTVTFTVENCSAGSGRIILGGGGYGTWRSIDGTYTEDITCSGVNGRVLIAGNSAFIGGIKNITVRKQLPTYTISELTSPHEQDGQTTFTSGLTYNQSTKSGVRVFEPTVTATGNPIYWRSGNKRLAPLVEFYNSDTSSMDNIIDILKYIIKDWGAVDADFGTTWTSVASTITSRGLTFERGYYIHESRQKILCDLCSISGVNIVPEEKLEIYLDSTTSVSTVTTSNVTKPNREGDGSVSYTRDMVIENDSIKIQFNEASEPEDALVDFIVPIKSGEAYSNTLDKTLDITGVTDTQDVQRIGILFANKLLNKIGKIKFGTLYSDSFIVGGVHTIYDSSDNLYGASKVFEIDSITFNPNTTLELEGTIRDATLLENWGDISPGAITTESSPSTNEVTVLTKAYDQAQDYVDNKWDGTDTSTTFEAVIDAAIAGGNALVTAGTNLNNSLLQSISLSSGGVMTVGNGADIQVASGGDIEVASGGDINLASGGDINVASGGKITIASGGQLIAYGSTGVEIASGGYLNVLAGGLMTIAATGTLDIYSSTGINMQSGGSLNVKASGGIVVEDGGGITIEDGGDLELQSTSNSTSVLTFYSSQSSGKYYDILLNQTGTAFAIRPQSSDCTFIISDGSNYFYDAYILASHNVDLQVDDCSIAIQNSGVQITIDTSYTYSFGNSALWTTSTLDLGTSSYPWDNIYGNDLYLNDNLYVYDYVRINEPSANSAIVVQIVGTTTDDTAYTIGCYDSGLNGVFGVNNDGDVNGNYFIPLANNSGAVGTGSWYFNYGKFYFLYSHSDVSFDTFDDLELISSVKPSKDEHGNTITDKHGFEKIDIFDQPKQITNFYDMPDELLKEYKITITTQEISDIIDGNIESVTKEINGGKVNPYTGETHTEVTIDKQFIKDRLAVNVTRQSALALGGINQLNAELTEDILEEVNGLLEDIIERINILENKGEKV